MLTYTEISIHESDRGAAPATGRDVNFSAEATTSVGEIHFGDFGPRCAAKGWAVFPQERNGKRMPAVVDGQVLKWGEYKDSTPDVATVERWGRQAYGANVAAILGRASACTFAIDIDVTDEPLSDAIQAAAIAHLGLTPFRRIGNWPKIVLIYRVATIDELPPNRSFDLRDGHAVEILGQGKPITIHGRHHKTNQRFSWPSGRMPSNSPPELATLVTPAQLDAFIEAVREIRSFKGSLRPTAIAEGEDDPSLDTSDLRTPPKAKASTDTREAWMVEQSWAWVRWNAGVIAPAVNGRRQLSEEGFARVMGAFAREIRSCLREDSRRNKLVEAGKNKLQAAVEKLLGGEMRPVPGARRLDDGVVVRPMSATAVSASAILTAPAPGREFKRVHVSDTAGPALTLDETAARHGERVSRVTATAIKDFVFGLRDRDPDAAPNILAVSTPVGAGKTSGLIRAVDDVARVVAEEGEGRKPRILTLMPQHKLMAEAKQRADGLGINSIVYKGKTHPESGCAPEMRAVAEVLEAAGVSSAGQCHASRMENGEKVETFCKYNPDDPNFDSSRYAPCPFILQQRELAKVDLAFAAHAYATCPAPAAMKAFDAVVVDESMASQLIKTRTFPLSVLDGDRRAARMTKTEAIARCGVRQLTEEDHASFAQEMAQRRSLAGSVLVEELRAGRDPAVRFLADAEGRSRTEVGTLAECLEAAKIVTGRAQRSSQEITPTTTLREAREMAGAVPGKWLIEEHKMWVLLSEQIERLRVDQKNRQLAEGIGLVIDEEKNGFSIGSGWVQFQTRLGRQNPQIWPLSKKRVQISWLSDWNFKDLPTLLLDATADEEILRRCFGRDVEVRRVEAPFRLRTILAPDCSFTKSRLVREDDDTPDTILEKSRLLEDVRRYVTTVATLHGDGGVLVIAPKAVRRLLAKMRLPSNVDFMHFGACRGLDWAKSHSACVLVGACYPDALEVDGMTAALSASDPEGFERLDPEGNGKLPFVTDDRRVPMRDGRELVVATPEYPGDVQGRLLRLIRDAELVQALGRLRPIHRDDAAELHILGTCVPAGVVVDHVTSVQGQSKRFGKLFDAALQNGGLVSAKVACDAGAASEFDDFRKEFADNSWLAKSFAVIERGGTLGYVCGYTDDDAVISLTDRAGARVVSLCRRKAFERPPYVEDLGNEPAPVETGTPIAATVEPEAVEQEPVFEHEAIVRMAALAKAGLTAWVQQVGGKSPADPDYDVFLHGPLAPDIDEIPF